MIWLILALFAALFTSLTTILAKIGIRNVNSNFATLYRTFIVVLCALVMTLVTGDLARITDVSGRNWIFLVLSGLSTGASWLCYYRALKLGDVNKVAPIDKSSYILTSILFLIFFFGDSTKGGDPLTIAMIALSVVLVGVGTLLMIDKRAPGEVKSGAWLIFAVASAVFAALVSLFVKIGLGGIPGDLGTLIRTVIVFLFSLAIVLARRDYRDAKHTDMKSLLFLTLSGLATGGAWLTEYYALGAVSSNPIAVSSLVKLSILFTMLFSAFILKEKFTKRSFVGLSLLISGILVVTLFSL